MNKQQASFMTADVLNNSFPYIAAVGSIFSPAVFGYTFKNIENFMQQPDMQSGLLNAFSLGCILTFYAATGKMYFSSLKDAKKIDELKNKSENDAIMQRNRIVISEKKALDLLLEKTASKELLEWGTVYKVDYENDTIIHSIVRPESASKNQLLHSPKENSIWVNTSKIKRLGFGGFHHYHPQDIHSFSASNYSINKKDKLSSDGFVNLLTFNMPDGPEIIGYDLENTYIPENAKNKQVLIKTTKNSILKYLSRY